MRKRSMLMIAIILMLSILSTSTVYAKQATLTIIKPEYESLEALSADIEDTTSDSTVFKFEKDGKYGVINESGMVIADSTYDEIWGEANGYILVRKNDKTGYMNPAGKLITKLQYDKYGCSGFYDGLAHVVKDGKHGFINTSGKTVIALKYDDAFNFVDGVAPVMLNGKWGLINKKGKLILKPKYAQIGYIAEGSGAVVSFVDGIAQVKTMEGKWGYIDVNGKEVVKPDCDEAYDSRNGFAPFIKDKKMGLATKKGVVLEPIYDRVYNFTPSGLTFFVQNKKLGIINNKMKVIAKAQYDSAMEISPDGYITIRKNNKYGVIDRNGKVIIKPLHEALGTFYSDLTWVLINDKIGYINTKNELVVPAEYERIDDWYTNSALGVPIVKKNGMYGIINNSGEYVAKPEYQSISPDTRNNLYIFMINDKYGVMDTTGKVILEPEYTDIYTKIDIIIATKASSSQLFNIEGELLTDTSFKNLESSYGYYTKLATFIYQEDGKYGAVTFHYPKK